MNENATTVKCERCHRVLTDPRSTARGYGPTCAVKRVAELAAATYAVAVTGDYTDEQMTKAVTLIADGSIRHRIHKLYFVRSSRGDATYEVDAATGGCTCPAGRHGRRCYHAAAARIRAAA
jgi:hypothetical protein